MMKKQKYDLTPPSPAELQQMKEYADKVVKRMFERRKEEVSNGMA